MVATKSFDILVQLYQNSFVPKISIFLWKKCSICLDILIKSHSVDINQFRKVNRFVKITTIVSSSLNKTRIYFKSLNKIIVLYNK